LHLPPLLAVVPAAAAFIDLAVNPCIEEKSGLKPLNS